MLRFCWYQKGFPNKWVRAHLILFGVINLIKLKKRALVGGKKEGGLNMIELDQEPISRSMQLRYIPVTAFS